MNKFLKLLVATLLAFASFIPISAKAAGGSEEFVTEASLKITYNSETNIASNIDLRFGSTVDTVDTNTYEYGLIVLASAEKNRFDNLDKTEFDAIKKEGKALNIIPKLDGNIYRFSWVITNVDKMLEFSFVARAYILNKNDNTITLASEKEHSVLTVIDEYLLMDDSLVSPTSKTVLKDIKDNQKYNVLEYIDPKTLWPEMTAVSANVKKRVEIGSFVFESTNRAFQYEKLTSSYKYEGHTYNGVFKSGGATDDTRYIKITPNGSATLKMWVSIGKGNFGNDLFLVNKLVKPNVDDPTSYVAKGTIGNYTLVEFKLEAYQDYYLWFSGQTYLRGIMLDSLIRGLK